MDSHAIWTTEVCFFASLDHYCRLIRKTALVLECHWDQTDSDFPSVNICPQELLAEGGKPQGITRDRGPNRDRLQVA
jgi:hypothetical protein